MVHDSIIKLRTSAAAMIWSLSAWRERGKRFAPVLDLELLRLQWPVIYGWPLARKWVDPILLGLRHRCSVELAEIPQDYAGIVIFRAYVLDTCHLVAIDYSDYMDINESCADNVSLYFKMQYATGGYSAEHIVPGGFIPGGMRLFSRVAELRNRRDRGRYLYDAYGRFGRKLGTAIRTRAMNILESQEHFRFHGGLSKVSYYSSLKEISRAKVCIDLPGNGPFCFRLVEYLAIGACTVAYPHEAEMPEPLKHGENIVYCKADLSDLVELCEELIEDQDRREYIEKQARDYFDSNLSLESISGYYIKMLLQRLMPGS